MYDIINNELKKKIALLLKNIQQLITSFGSRKFGPKTCSSVFSCRQIIKFQKESKYPHPFFTCSKAHPTPTKTSSISNIDLDGAAVSQGRFYRKLLHFIGPCKVRKGPKNTETCKKWQICCMYRCQKQQYLYWQGLFKLSKKCKYYF